MLGTSSSSVSSIIREGGNFHGVTEFGVGVFRNTHGLTYAGQQKGGYARGLGVTTGSNGSKEYAEYGPGGWHHGRCLDRYADGLAGYYMFERGKRQAFAYVSAGGGCQYNGATCAQDDRRLLALIARVAPVEVRPAAPHMPLACHSDPTQSSDGTAGWFCPPRRWRRPRPPRCSPMPHAVAGGRATQAGNGRNAKCDHAVMRSLAGSTWGSHGRLGLMRPSAP